MSLSDEDLALVGGSDAAAVAGVHPRKTAHDVYRRIVEGYEQEQTAPMRRGILLEPVIRAMYVDETGEKLLGPRTIQRKFMRASLDDETKEKVVEFKSASIHMAREWGEPGTDEVPPEYLCQVQWYMHHAEHDAADLAVLLGGDELRIYSLTGDKEFQAMLLESVERFWKDHILRRSPPPIDGSESCADWLASLYPEHRKPLLVAPPEAEAWMQILQEAKRGLATLEEQEREARNHLEALIGEAEGMAGKGWRISWKRSKDRQSTDWEAVAKDAGATPDQVQKHTISRAGPRIFRPTFNKAGSK